MFICFLPNLASGSILAGAKSFNFHWVSRDEYKEYGLEMAHHSY